jgi:adenylylsulfate kinase
MNAGVVVWFTGLPASGKSTLAGRVRDALAAAARPSVLLDGDEVRRAFVPKIGYTEAARAGFYATLGKLAALIASQGLIVLVAATAQRRVWREWARAAAPRFIEVHVKATPDECAERDEKGLYTAAKAGLLKGLPGVDAEYEAPAAPTLTCSGGLDPEVVDRVVSALG